MKKLLLGAAALTLMFTSCNKDDENGTTTNTFKVGDTTYNTVSVHSSGSLVFIGGTSGSTEGNMVFSFSGPSAPAAGTYKVVADAPTSSEVKFTANKGAIGVGTSYSSTGAGTVNAVVSYDGSKIKISMPDAPARQAGGTAEVMVNANVIAN